MFFKTGNKVRSGKQDTGATACVSSSSNRNADSCGAPQTESVQNAIWVKSPCGVAKAGSVVSHGREDPEGKPRKRDKEDEEPRGNEGEMDDAAAASARTLI